MANRANHNEPTMSSKKRTSTRKGSKKQESMIDLVKDMRNASNAVLLQTAQQVVGEKVATSSTLDLAAEERIPKFDARDLNLGKVLGRGGFCTVKEVRGFGSGISLSSDGDETASTFSFRNATRRISRLRGGRRKPSASAALSSGSDWASLGASERSRNINNHDNDNDNNSNNKNDKSSNLPVVVDLNIAGVENSKRPERGTKYAMKRVSLEHADRITFLKGTVDLAMETKYLATLDHENIITMYGVSSDGPFTEGYFIILEKMKQTLTKRIKKWMDVDRQCKGLTAVFPGSKKKLQILQCERIEASYNIARGTNYLHQRKIIFRDLKPDNIGFNSKGVLKIFDLGLAKELRKDEQQKGGLYKMTGFTGAMRYMAPEVGLHQPYNLSADVYSWAMILWFMLSLEPPFGLYSEKMIDDRVFRRGYRPKIFTTWSSQISGIMKKAWHKDLSERPTFKEIANVMKDELKGIDPKRAAMLKA